MYLKTTRTYLEAITTALSQENKITFKEGKSWTTNVLKREIIYNPLDLLNLSALVAKGIILHEIGHILYTDKIQKETEKLKIHPSMMNVYNAFEDMRIEEKLCDKYGDFANEALAYSNFYGFSGRYSAKKQGVLKEPKLSEFLTCAQGRGIEDSSINNFSYGQIGEIAASLEGLASEPVQKVLRSVDYNRLNGIIRQTKNALTTEEVKEIIDSQLYSYIEPLLEEADKQQQEMQTMADQMKETKTFVPSREGELQEIYSNIPTEEELRALLGGYINTLARRLNDVLKERLAIRYTGAHKSGRLLSKNAYKVTVSDEKRIFSKRNNPDTPHYTITMLLDESGSMSGNSHVQTYIASFVINEACKKLKFKMDYIKYNHDITYIKDLTGYRKMNGGGNQEERPLQALQKRLDKGEENIVFMMTDGGVGIDPKPYIYKLEKERNATVIAVGIGLDSNYLARYFPKFIEAPKIEELPVKMINLLRSLIHR